MNTSSWIRFRFVGMLPVAPLILTSSTLASHHLSGRVLGVGAPITNSTVALWETWQPGDRCLLRPSQTSAHTSDRSGTPAVDKLLLVD